MILPDFQTEHAAYERSVAVLAAKINQVFPPGANVLIRDTRGNRLATVSDETSTLEVHCKFPSGFFQRVHFSRSRKR